MSQAAPGHFWHVVGETLLGSACLVHHWSEGLPCLCLRAGVKKENGAWHVRRYESAVVVLGPSSFRDADSLVIMNAYCSGRSRGLSIIISRGFVTGSGLGSIWKRIDGATIEHRLAHSLSGLNLTTYMLRSNAVQRISSVCLQKTHDT
jgi:hypothetical protein